MAGGIGTAQLCTYLDRGDGEYPGVYYLIPNTAIAVMSGMTFYDFRLLHAGIGRPNAGDV